MDKITGIIEEVLSATPRNDSWVEYTGIGWYDAAGYQGYDEDCEYYEGTLEYEMNCELNDEELDSIRNILKEDLVEAWADECSGFDPEFELPDVWYSNGTLYVSMDYTSEKED